MVGCNPLVAPAAFEVSMQDWGDFAGWGHELSKSCSWRENGVVLNLLNFLPRNDQLSLCKMLSKVKRWFAVVREKALHAESREVLTEHGVRVTEFKRGTLCVACKGSWRKATLRTVQSRENWQVWASKGVTQGEDQTTT